MYSVAMKGNHRLVIFKFTSWASQINISSPSGTLTTERKKSKKSNFEIRIFLHSEIQFRGKKSFFGPKEVSLIIVRWKREEISPLLA